MSGAVATKGTRLVAAGEPVTVVDEASPYVSRGGAKLAAALDRFSVPVSGCRALDAGSSTGGFTDALLQAGAASVVAVDVGTHQLHEKLRDDARVAVYEQTDIRRFDVAAVGGPVDLVVADLSFISAESVMDALVRSVDVGGDLVVLVKPQFEADRTVVSKGQGIVSDPSEWCRALERVIGAAAVHGAAIMDAMVSPIRGAEGNVEFLVHLAAPGRDVPGGRAADLVERTVAAVEHRS